MLVRERLVREAIGKRIQDVHARAARLWRDDPAAMSIIVPVHVKNHASWRALESAHFRRVAAGHLTPDNPADTPHHFVYRLDRAEALAPRRALL
jgi:aminoglycoside 6'-N-acetyltransferase